MYQSKLEWVSSISNRSHDSHYALIDGVEKCFQIRMTCRDNVIYSLAKKQGYDLYVLAENYEWDKIKHGKTPKELKQYVDGLL